MKNYVFILGLATLGFFTSCSSDDDSTPENNNNTSHVGNYELVSVKVSKAIDADNDGLFNDTELVDKIACEGNVVLNENNSFAWRSINVYQSGNLGCNQFGALTGTFAVTDGSLQLSYVEYGGGVYLLSINGDEVKFSETANFYTSIGNEEQLAITYTYKK